MIVTTMHWFHLYLRTVHGYSDSFYSREGLLPSQGLCEINGVAPDFFLEQSRMLLKFMKQQVNEESLFMSYSLIRISEIAFMAIEDTYLLTLGRPNKYDQSIKVRAQENLI